MAVKDMAQAFFATVTMVRSQMNKTERRAIIIRIAKNSFFRRGYSATTMSGLAAELGGSKATLWSYFSSKEALFETVVNDELVRLHEELEDNINAGMGTQSLHAFAKIFVAHLISPVAISLHRLIISEAPRFPKLGQLCHQHAFQPVHFRLTAFFESEITAGLMRRSDASQAACEILALLRTPQQFLLWNMTGLMSDEDMTRYTHTAVENFLRAYRIQHVDPYCADHDQNASSES